MSCAPLPATRDTHGPAPATFRCARLACLLAPRICANRQAEAARQRTKQASRGQGSDFPSCANCAQGAEVLAALGVELRGGGSRGGFHRESAARAAARAAQLVARERLERVGLLAIPPCLDEPPAEEEV